MINSPLTVFHILGTQKYASGLKLCCFESIATKLTPSEVLE